MTSYIGPKGPVYEPEPAAQDIPRPNEAILTGPNRQDFGYVCVGENLKIWNPGKLVRGADGQFFRFSVSRPDGGW